MTLRCQTQATRDMVVPFTEAETTARGLVRETPQAPLNVLNLMYLETMCLETSTMKLHLWVWSSEERSMLYI